MHEIIEIINELTMKSTTKVSKGEFWKNSDNP